jgi:protocatechuate 4,5-dioxygenase beta chain
MAKVIGGVFTSHVPAIGGAIAKGLQDDPYWKPFFDGFRPVHEWLNRNKPDYVVTFSNDHGLNFFLDKMPTFAVGAAAQYDNADEGWGLPIFNSVPGSPDFSWHIINTLVEEEFDIVTCQEMLIDHALSIPLELSWPDLKSYDFKLVPVCINTVQHPLPSPKRALALGRAVHKAIQSWDADAKVLIFGTGGLSHQLDGERAGFMNPDYDKFCLDNLPSNPDALSQHSALDIVELSGSQGIEILNWIAARGAMGDPVKEASRNYHIPISNTAAATVLMTTEHALAPA